MTLALLACVSAIAGLGLATRIEPLAWLVSLPAVFLPYLLLGGPVALVGAVLLRSRCVAAAGGVLCVVGVLLYGQQLLPGTPPPPESHDIRLMTYNVQAVTDREDVDAALRSVAQESPELLALQEVHGAEAHRRLLDVLTDRGFDCAHQPYYADTSVGLALCTSSPLVLTTVRPRTFHRAGKWTFLFTEVKWNESTVNVIVPHLLPFRISAADPLEHRRRILRDLRRVSRWHRQEAEALVHLVGNLHDPTIIAGDFNSTPDHAVHLLLRRHLDDAHRRAGFGLGATYRYLVPLRIDYVYVDDGLDVLDCWVGEAGPSDHRPVVARLRLAGERRQ